MDPLLHPLFRPIQINGRDTSRRYIEREPSDSLRAYVACYWESGPVEERERSAVYEVGPSLSPPKADTMERVLPDGCTDVLFTYDPATKRHEMSYCGTFTQPFVIPVQAGSRASTFAVRFFPGGAHFFHGAPVGLFTSGHFPLAEIWPEQIQGVGERIFEALDFGKRVQIMDEYLNLLLLRRSPDNCSLMKNLLHHIFVSGGSMGISELAEREVVSERQMNRRFAQWIGISPKKFSEVVRFHSVLRSLQSSRTADWAELALRHGFFDQAHLIRDFRRFYGEAPYTAARDWALSDFYNNPTRLPAIIETSEGLMRER